MHETKTIHVVPGSELDRLLEEADEAPIELEKSGARYRVSRVSPDPTPAPSSSTRSDSDTILNLIDISTTATRPSPDEVARSIEGIRQAIGGWKGLVDAEEFIAYIRERRRTANRPSVRL